MLPTLWVVIFTINTSAPRLLEVLLFNVTKSFLRFTGIVALRARSLPPAIRSISGGIQQPHQIPGHDIRIIHRTTPAIQSIGPILRIPTGIFHQPVFPVHRIQSKRDFTLFRMEAGQMYILIFLMIHSITTWLGD